MFRIRQPRAYGEPGWEYLLYIDEIAAGIERYEPQWRDYEARRVDCVGPEISYRDVLQDLASRPPAIVELMKPFDSLFTTKAMTRAFGRPGKAGDARHIRDLAAGVIDIYASLLDWAISTRGARVPVEARQTYSDLAELADEPLHEFREWARDLDTRGRAGIEAARSDPPPEHPISLRFDLTLTVPDETTEKMKGSLRDLEAIVISKAQQESDAMTVRDTGGLK